MLFLGAYGVAYLSILFISLGVFLIVERDTVTELLLGVGLSAIGWIGMVWGTVDVIKELLK